jgi:glucose/arabinose dehydrogenase
MKSFTLMLFIIGATFTLSPLHSQSHAQERREGVAAFGDWRGDAPGVLRRITVGDLPAPLATSPTALRSKVLPRPSGASLLAPAGFTVQLIAQDLKGPRTMRAAPNGDIFLAESQGGGVRVLRFVSGEDKPAKNVVFVDGLDRPYGIAFYPPGPQPRYVYIATETAVLRYPYSSGELKPSGAMENVSSLPAGGRHWTRDLAFSPDGATLYVSIGSESNVAEGAKAQSPAEIEALEKTEGLGAMGGAEKGRAIVLALDPNGGQKRDFATGLRNCSGLTIRPGSDEVWCAANERDMLGDDLPPDYATKVSDGAFYGWPWYYIGSHPDPRHSGERPDLANKVAVPDVLIQPHSAPLGISFYDGAQFPPEYKGDAFVALHGSWNRSKDVGYKIIRLRFNDGKPTGDYEDFVTGFVIDNGHVWGRPVGVVVAPDGSLLFSEDGAGTIWRVFYMGK